MINTGVRFLQVWEVFVLAHSPFDDVIPKILKESDLINKMCPSLASKGTFFISNLIPVLGVLQNVKGTKSVKWVYLSDQKALSIFIKLTGSTKGIKLSSFSFAGLSFQLFHFYDVTVMIIFTVLSKLVY